MIHDNADWPKDETLTYRPHLSQRERAEARLIGDVTREIQRAYEAELERGGFNQTSLALVLGLTREDVHRQLARGTNLTLRQLAAYADALGCDVEVRFVERGS